MGNVREFNDSNFTADVLESPEPVLVDFWATWCGPCLRIAPLIEELADANAGKVRVGKLDIEENRETAARFRIEGVPTVLVFNGGEVVERLSGVQSKERLQQAIDAALTL